MNTFLSALSQLKRHLFYFQEVERTVQQLKMEAKCSPSLKATQVQLFHYYRTLAKNNPIDLPSIFDTGFRVYSQFEEDGLILFLLAVFGIKTRSFIDIGAGDGINSNCANLAINWGFHGVFIDGNEKNTIRGSQFGSGHKVSDANCFLARL